MTNTCSTYQSSNQVCTTCTGQPAIPATPGRAPSRVPVANLAWNAGAVTATPVGADKTLSGDLHIAFDAEPCGGIVLGLDAAGRGDVTDPATILHAWYVKTVNGATFAQPIERGVLKSSALAIATGARLEVRRVGRVVSYRAADVEHYVSDTSSYGALLGAVAMFASGDSV